MSYRSGSLPVFPGVVLRPVDGGLVNSRIPDIAKALHVLSGGTLTLVVRCNKRTGVQECYDLFETDKHGEMHWVTRWGLDEVDRILEDVRQSDRRSPGHVPVSDRIRSQHDARIRAKEAERDELAQEVGELIDHAWNSEIGEATVQWHVKDKLKS